jgi:hypothetical protein
LNRVARRLEPVNCLDVEATAGLLLALAGAVVISLARESGGEADPSAGPLPGTATA